MEGNGKKQSDFFQQQEIPGEMLPERRIRTRINTTSHGRRPHPELAKRHFPFHSMIRVRCNHPSWTFLYSFTPGVKFLYKYGFLRVYCRICTVGIRVQQYTSL